MLRLGTINFLIPEIESVCPTQVLLRRRAALSPQTQLCFIFVTTVGAFASWHNATHLFITRVLHVGWTPNQLHFRFKKAEPQHAQLQSDGAKSAQTPALPSFRPLTQLEEHAPPHTTPLSEMDLAKLNNIRRTEWFAAALKPTGDESGVPRRILVLESTFDCLVCS